MSLDSNSAIAGAMLTSFLGGIGYLIKRRLSGASDRERATQMLSYAEIASKMKADGLTMEEIENIEMLAKRRKRKKDRLLEPVPIEMSPYWTQSAMNVRAGGAADVAEAKLASTLAELKSILSDAESLAVDRAQAAWREYRDRQEEFVGLQVSGGTMEPLIRSSEREILTQQREKALRGTIDERKDRSF